MIYASRFRFPVGFDIGATGWRIEGAGFGSNYPETVVPTGPRARGELTHMADNWNLGSGDDDFQQPIYAVANGIVEYVGSPSGWEGQVIVIRHDLPPGATSPSGEQSVYSVYAHLEAATVAVGNVVQIGDQIAQLGDPVGFPSHLHFEMRDAWTGAIDDGYALDVSGNQVGGDRDWFDPSAFILANKADAIFDDFASDASTTANIEIGVVDRDQIWGVLEQKPDGQFDTDWVAVDLVAGKNLHLCVARCRHCKRYPRGANPCEPFVAHSRSKRRPDHLGRCALANWCANRG